MVHIRLQRPDDFPAWRDAARGLVAAGIPPETVHWAVGDDSGDLFADAPFVASDSAPAPAVPRAFITLAESAILHRDPERFRLLHIMLLKVIANPKVMEDAADPLLRRLSLLAKDVRRDIHKMRAFLRFREVANEGGARFVAWFEPDHHIVRANAGFFVRRFASMRWSILTPDVSIHWNGETLNEGPGAVRADAPGGDPVEAVWKTYYASIFNPARMKKQAMLKEMPRKYWHNMPETALVGDLIAGARRRERQMIGAARTPERPDNLGQAWAALREEALGCTRCPLYRPATQPVFGEGPLEASLMLVGEQPGDQEDIEGRVFVGPAGQVLDEALAAADMDRARLYITNAVKHFKFVPRGKRRLHQRPLVGEIKACKWWLDEELAMIRPKLVLALGATALRSLTGRTIGVNEARESRLTLDDGTELRATIHPSYVLRIPEADRRAEEMARFIADLKAAQTRAAALAKAA